MYAQLITISIKPDKIDEFRELYEEYINPEIKVQKGYRNFYLLIDRERSKAISVTIWESRKDAEASEEVNLYLEQRASYPLYREAPVREGFEVAVKG
ncbi:MAG: antibiotic biosynthesis monooxygenase [PVC group bacterium]